MTLAVEANGIAKRHGSLVAVDDLTFAAEHGRPRFPQPDGKVRKAYLAVLNLGERV